MNEATGPATNDSRITYCPSCAARFGEDISAGQSLKCPVCGTEFISGASAESAESEIAKSDQPLSQAEGKRRQSTEDMLLERLQNEPPLKRPIPVAGVAVILIAILAASIAIFKYTAKPDKFAAGQEIDSNAIAEKRIFLQHIIDSIGTMLKSNPNDTNLHVSLADAYYDAGRWDQSMGEFQTYLRLKPKDPDARVDYAYAIAQGKQDLQLAISEIDTALIFKPDHLNALINAGILSAQAINDTNHMAALARSRKYFERAKAIAAKTDPKMAGRIDTLLQEINRTRERMTGTGKE